ncbi:uncharacterized protein tmem79b isoform X2 [Hippoglossus hippoglossus]|uniref:uncharacterized protein tmem79b isoform X2 n=1 Tax=Hippoglossus hippoglossus TaxID=8267 RepID=UPI00148E69D0|nr:uncharacterized protein tmem79b isoform X2 [Hippoglossus hippoglossus]
MRRHTEGEDEVVTSSMTESSTLQWPGDRQIVGQTGGKMGEGQTCGQNGEGQTGKGDRMSVRSSEQTSWTESERVLMADGGKGEGMGSVGEWEGLTTYLDKEVEPTENHLPEKAAQVFSPAVTVLPSLSSPRQSEAFWDMESERSPFLGPRGASQDYNQHDCQYEWTKDTPPARCWLVLGVTRLRSGVLRPLFDDEMKEAELYDVTVHHRFVSDSTSLFLIYFLQLVVMAMYLSQEHLKLVPLLTVVFAFGRLIYWVAAAFGSSVRGFGFGLSFLPSLVMMVANIYFIFMVEAAGSIFSVLPPPETLAPPSGRQRFWG